MTDINFIELAEYCQNRYKENNTSNEAKYISTLFVAITKEGEIIPSETPHILRNAEKCILFHMSSHKGDYNNSWYTYFKFQFINNDGVVSDNRLDDKFELRGNYLRGTCLYYKENEIFSVPKPWENGIVKVWELYLKIKDLKTYEEIILMTDLYRKDEKILELENQIEGFKFAKYLLEQERNQYKSLLDEIKQIIETK